MTRLRDICVDDVRQKLHLEAGPGTRLGSYLCGKIAGSDWQAIFRDARRWFEANYETLPKDGIATKVFLFGFSRGALIARHFAAWLDKLGAAVAYLGLWDTVDSTVGLDVAADCPRNVKKARHAVSRDETRKFFQYVPLKGGKGQVAEMLFPGSHSDVGGLYGDNHLVADLADGFDVRDALVAELGDVAEAVDAGKDLPVEFLQKLQVGIKARALLLGAKAQLGGLEHHLGAGYGAVHLACAVVRLAEGAVAVGAIHVVAHGQDHWRAVGHAGGGAQACERLGAADYEDALGLEVMGCGRHAGGLEHEPEVLVAHGFVRIGAAGPALLGGQLQEVHGVSSLRSCCAE